MLPSVQIPYQDESTGCHFTGKPLKLRKPTGQTYPHKARETERRRRRRR